MITREKNILNSQSFSNNTRFESIFNNYEIIIFDYIHTTAMVSAMCSNKPIVLFDFYDYNFIKEFSKKLEQRVVKVRVDNNFFLSKEKLKCLIKELDKQYDPSWFRKLYYG